MEKLKYATTMFSGLTKSAYIKVEKDFYDFIEDTYNQCVFSLVVNEEVNSLRVDVSNYAGFDTENNDEITREQRAYVEAFNDMVFAAKKEGLDELELERE